MERIESFKVNHDLLEPGIYISRVDNDVVTYDIRTRKPNNGSYMDYAAIHTIEHIVATYVRNSLYSKNVLYFGPMGCRTGFYLLVRDNVSTKNVIELIKDAFIFLSYFEGVIPGSSKQECGNYLEHDLQKAKLEAKMMLGILSEYSEQDVFYAE